MYLGPQEADAIGLPYVRAWMVGEIDYGGGAVLEEWWWHGIQTFDRRDAADRVAAKMRQDWTDRQARGHTDEPDPAPHAQHVTWRQSCACDCGALVHEVDVEAWIVRQVTWDGRHDAVRVKVRPLTRNEEQRQRDGA